MNTTTRVIAAAAALLTAAVAHIAQAQQAPSYPRVVASGVSGFVENGAGRSNSIVGRGLNTTLAAGAEETILYPRSVEDGENSWIDFGPRGDQNPAIGGGRVVVTGTGEDAHTVHLDDQYAQHGRVGYRQIYVGSGESQTMVWVPEGLSPTELALVGADGSLPSGGNLLGGIFARIRAAQ